MNRPELKSCIITPNPTNARATLTVSIGVEDVEIIFGTDYKYAKASDTEVYAGEDGVI